MTDSSSNESKIALGSITRGASLFFVGKVFANGLKLLLNILLTRGLGAGLYGVYAFSLTLIRILAVVARVGSGKSLLRFIPSYEDNARRQNGVAGLAYMTVFVGSVLLSTGLYIFAPTITTLTLENPLMIDVLRIFAIILPFNAVLQLTTAVFRALEKLEYQVLVSDLAEPIIQILIVAFALTLGYSLLGIMAGLTIAAALVSLLAITLLYLRTDVRPSFLGRRSRSELFEFYNFSAPLTLKDLGSILYTRVDILMVGFLLMERNVGLYQVAILVTGLLTLPLSGFNQLFPPIASRLYSKGDLQELESIYAIITRWTVTIAIPPALVTLLYPEELLRIFGPEFTGGAAVLVLFTIGNLTNCAVGPSGFLLMMTDHQYLNLVNQWVLGILNVILNYYFILEFGLIGAALATAGILTFINIVRVIEVWYTERLVPYSKSYWKPAVAGIVSGIFMDIMQIMFSGYLLLIIGAISGGILFLVLIFVLGVEEEDREFFQDFVFGRVS